MFAKSGYPSSPPIVSATNTLKLFYSNETINGGKLMISPYGMHRSVEHHRIIQECNGLLLLESLYVRKGHDGLYYGPPSNERDREWSYYVYNPATRQSREITLAENTEYPHVAVASLAFDPSKSPYYKIGCFTYTTLSQSPLSFWSYNYQIEVYDSESHSWKVNTLEAAFTLPYMISYNGVYWKIYGVYYRFDISKNEMKTLSFPQTPIDVHPGICIQSYLQESKGRLYYLQIICEEEDYELESVAMWELGRDGDGDDHHSRWLFKYHHSLGEDTNTKFFRLTVGSDGDETCSLLVHQDGKVRAYNFLDKTYEDLFELDTKLLLVFQFGEILALV